MKSIFTIITTSIVHTLLKFQYFNVEHTLFLTLSALAVVEENNKLRSKETISDTKVTEAAPPDQAVGTPLEVVSSSNVWLRMARSDDFDCEAIKEEEEERVLFPCVKQSRTMTPPGAPKRPPNPPPPCRIGTASTIDVTKPKRDNLVATVSHSKRLQLRSIKPWPVSMIPFLNTVPNSPSQPSHPRIGHWHPSCLALFEMALRTRSLIVRKNLSTGIFKALQLACRIKDQPVKFSRTCCDDLFFKISKIRRNAFEQIVVGVINKRRK